MSESYLDSSVDVKNLDLPGYYLIRSGHSSNAEWGSVCTYSKNCLPLRVIDISYLLERIDFEVKMGYKFVIFLLFIGLYKPVSDSELLSIKFEMSLEIWTQKNPF